ncbi:MAG: hypothetical protein V1891_03285 [bacterium]
MENLEIQPYANAEKNERELALIEEIKKLQQFELAEARQLKNNDNNIPSHIQEFLVVEPKFLKNADKEAFKKFQEFLQMKEKINFLEEVEKFMDYFKSYKLQCDKESKKFTVLKKMKEEGKDMEEIQEEIQKIYQEPDIQENSKFFMDYIVNRVNGENSLLISKLMDTTKENKTKTAHL